MAIGRIALTTPSCYYLKAGRTCRQARPALTYVASWPDMGKDTVAGLLRIQELPGAKPSAQANPVGTSTMPGLAMVFETATP